MEAKLQTARYNLVAIENEDQDFIFEGLSHPDVIPFYGVSYNTLEETQVQMNFYNELERKDTGLWWKIVNLVTNEKVGAIGFNNYQPQHHKAEIGYWLLPNYWGQGIIQEVMPVVISYLFQYKKLHRIEALVETGNASSDKVLIKAGFVFEGVLRDFEKKNGRFISLSMYSLLSTDKPNIK
jgi:ribosomal-protein-alanine N-acetyltransferase